MMMENPELSVTEETSKQNSGSMASVLRVRDFRLLWIGELISLLGDQFYLIALPWLVLQLTGDAFATGTVLAVAGIPRAIFMLVGGALTDRFSPRTLMLASNWLRLALTAVLTLLVLANLIQLWMLYVFALLFGLMDAFYFPAQSAIVPQLVRKEQLQAANSIAQGTAQISIFAGPVLAGLLIAAFGGASNTLDTTGIGLAFGVDAITFLVSVITLSLMRVRREKMEGNGDDKGVMAAIREGLRFVWSDTTLRVTFIVIAALNLINGAIIVGIPVLADKRLPEGAAAYGGIMGAFGIGALIGMILAGALPKLSPNRFGFVLLGLIAFMGLEISVFGFATTTLAAVLIMLVSGLTNGYVNILFFTWLQSRVPQGIMGRVMSLLMFASIGLNPVSTAGAGALLSTISLEALFLGAGLMMTVIALISLTLPEVRAMGHVPETIEDNRGGIEPAAIEA